MQYGLGFAAEDITRWRRDLAPLLAGAAVLPRRRPIGQLVKSLISGRTRDAVSLAAYRRLAGAFGSPAAIAAAELPRVAQVIADVTFADNKAGWLVEALRLIAEEHPDFDLEPLRTMPVEAALAWLERLPGVGRKVAASTLNASTLARPCSSSTAMCCASCSGWASCRGPPTPARRARR